MPGRADYATYARRVTNSRSDDSYTTIVDANQRVHGILASSYNETEPHFREENRAKVRARLEALAEQAPAALRFLDLGCGTGFILDLASDLFDRLDGIDATQAMLDRINPALTNVFAQQGVVEELPFDDNIFDMVTAYSFLDHLEDHLRVLKEAHRVLKPGGGTALMFDARLWHSGGHNTTDAWRHSLTVNFCRSWMKQRVDLPRLLGAGYRSQISERAAQRLGYSSQVPAPYYEYYQPAHRRLYSHPAE